MKLLKYLLFTLILLVSICASAAIHPKTYDPLEPLNKTVPPNILVAVDNSGSMNQDTNNQLIMDFKSVRSVWPGTGDFWHYNLPGQPAWDHVPAGELFDVRSESIGQNITSLPRSVTLTVAGASDEVEYAAIAVDVWIPVTLDSRNADITITLSHDGTSAVIHPETQWFTFRKSDGDPKSYDEICCDGRAYCTDDKKCRRYRIMYAFPDFLGANPNGNWTISVSSQATQEITLDAVYLSHHPLPSKIAVLKVVLQQIMNQSAGVRLALGTYKANWTKPYSYYNYLFDPTGTYWAGSYYLWWVDSTSPGFSLWQGWPADQLSCDDNRAELLDWVSMDELAPGAFNDAGDQTHEIMARGYTPIQSCMKDILDGLNNAESSLSNLAYSKDPYQACRQYAVVFLTDGACTESNCNNVTIRDTIRNIYRSHEISVGSSEAGTRTYVIGLSMSDENRDVLDMWADAGDDGELNSSGTAYMPKNSKDLMQALSQAIYEASAQQVAVNSDVIFGTIDPDKADDYNPLFGTKTVTLSNDDGSSAGTATVLYPAVSGNIMFTTMMFYPTWEGTVCAYQPMYKRIVSGSGTDESNLYYFPNGDYPILWDARSMLSERLNGTSGTDGTHINGIRDAMDLTDTLPLPTDGPDWRDIRMVDPENPQTTISLNHFIYDKVAEKWRPDPTIASLVADRLFSGDISKGEKFIVFLQSRQLADITYSTPALIAEPEMGFEEWSEAYFNFKINKRASRLPIVTVGANDGMLHAFSAYTGRELWAIIPVSVQESVKSMLANYDSGTNPSGQSDITMPDYLGRAGHIYGVASSPKVADINLGYDSDTETWGTILICGLGAGGHGYFALNLTDTTNPVPMWDTSRERDYQDMGESWSYPSLWQILVDGHSVNDTPHGVPAGIFTSGPSPDSSEGKAMYLINLSDGSLIEKSSPVGMASDAFLMGAPGGILDLNQQFLKGAYFGDTRGGLYRFGYGDGLCKVYQTPTATCILSTPAVYVDENKVEWVAFGELGMEDPSRNMFASGSTLYSFKVETCTESKTLTNLASVASTSGLNVVVPLGANDGYRYELPTNEILFTNPLTTRFYYEDSEGLTQTQAVSVFVTYQYPESGDTCGTGNSFMYMFGIADLFIADPDLDGNVASPVGEGRPGNPVKTGITGTVWINSEDGPIRIMPADDRVDTAVVPLYFPFSGSDARKLGAGAWMVK
jgi:hypothetical protein